MRRGDAHGALPHAAALSVRLAALRYRDFRLLWSGELLSTTGSQMQTFAINWHVFQLLNGRTLTLELAGQELVLGAEALGLGGLGLVRILPIILFSLLGGMAADAWDRRRLMVITRVLAALLSLWLALLTLGGGATLALIYLPGALAAGLMAFDMPARQSLVPHLVRREHLSNAISLEMLIWHMANILGPALAGVLIGLGQAQGAHYKGPIGMVYALTAAGMLLAAVAMALLRQRTASQGRKSMNRGAFMEGLRFTFRTRIIRGTMLLDFLAVFFGSARTLLPLIAANVLGLNATGYGLLAAAQPVGAFLAGGALALTREIRRQGLVLLVSVALYGVATTLFGLSTSLALSWLLFALTGAGDTVSSVIRNTIRQMNTPDRMRGRMSGVNMAFATGGPQLGEIEAGLVAAVFGAPFAIVSGGVAALALTAVIALRYPRLRRYTSASASA